MISLKKLIGEGAFDDPLQGKSKTNAKNWVTTKVNKVTHKGLYSDAYWLPVNRIWKEFDSLGIDWTPTGSTYEHDYTTLKDGSRAQVPVRKIWTFEIKFINNRDKKDTLYGRIVAAGAGSVEDPLDKYDIVVTLG